MSEPPARTLGLIAGRGAYPLLLAESARRHGREVFAVAFRGETDRAIGRFAARVEWMHVGQMLRLLDALRASGVSEAVMAGQITPTNLFRVRMDAKTLEMLRALRLRNAETIFGAVAAELRAIGIHLLPASSFMADHMPAEGLLSARAPTEPQARDIELGLRVARATSGLDIGQTVVIKEGTVLAVEAFEGTNAAILRAGRLGGPGAVVVKAAKTSHDMRFDIPVVGRETLRVLQRARAAVLAVEAGRSIVLEREKVVEECNRLGLVLTAIKPAGETA